MPTGCVNHVPEHPSTISPVHTPLAGGEGGARRGSGGRVRWAVPPLRPRGLLHLTPTLSAPKGGEGDFGCQMCACPSAGRGGDGSGLLPARSAWPCLSRRHGTHPL